MKNNTLSLLLPIRSIVFLLVFVACSAMAKTEISQIGHWWSMIAVVVNILTILLLVYAAGRKGQSFGQLINYRKGSTRWAAIVFVSLGILVVGMAGMYLAGFLVYGNLFYAPPVMIAPIAKWIAIVNVVLLPVSTTFAEEGLYLGCGVNQIKNKYVAVLVPAFFYALQHCFIPTLFDGRYILYRFLSFLPLTILLCWYYYRKRNPVPIMVGHALIDVATAAQIVATSTIPGFYEAMCGM